MGTLTDIPFYISIISYAVVIISSTAGMYFVYKAYKAGEAIREKTFGLGEGLNNAKAEDYYNFIKGINIPNRKIYWNTLQAGYKLTVEDESIDGSIKIKLRRIILSKGILVE